MKSILYYAPTDADILESIDTEYADLASFDADAVDTFDNIGNVRQELNRKRGGHVPPSRYELMHDVDS